MLEDGNETSLTNITHFELVAHAANVIIKCNDSAGLAFIGVKEVVLKNITILNCGADRTSSSTTSSNPPDFLNFSVAVYMKDCSDITLQNVAINSSQGTGLTIYDPQKSVMINNSTFANNNNSNQQQGGGGLQIEFTYCSPGDLKCITTDDTVPNQSSNVTIVINSTSFINNNASQGEHLNYKRINSKLLNFPFGRGGGIGIVLKGNCTGISVSLESINITNNEAVFGGGFYIGVHDNAQHNTFQLKKVNLINNINSQLKESYRRSNYRIKDGSGGGGKVFLLSTSSESMINNTIIISNCTFDSNGGITGGGLSVELNLNNRKDNKDKNNRLIISKTKFTQNIAFLGAAAYFTQEFLSPCNEFCVLLLLQQLHIESNSVICSTSTQLTFSALQCSGILYSSFVPMKIMVLNSSHPFVFKNNNGSGLELHATYADILNHTILFHNNSASNGGAIALYGCSYIVIHENVRLNFTGNQASSLGGAIYSDVCTSNNQPTTLASRCFLQYYDSKKHPDNWNASFTFMNNKISKTQSYNSTSASIYATNAISCWFPNDAHEEDQDHFDLNTTFCWSNWNYSPDENCSQNIDSATAYIQVNSDSELDVVPGGKTPLPLSIYDGTGGTASPNLMVCIDSADHASFSSSSPNRACKLTHDGSITLYSDAESDFMNSINLSVTTRDKIPLLVDLSIKFQNCTWPLHLKQNKDNIFQCELLEDYYCCSAPSTCNCNRACQLNDLVQGKVYVREQYGQCMSTDDNDNHFAGHCPLYYYNYSCKQYNGTTNVPKDRCSSHRKGVLCGQCKENYSVPINSIYLECKDCSHHEYWGLFEYLLLQILPETIMLLLIIIFNLKISNGSVSGYILYSQIISVNMPAWYYPAWLTNYWLHNTNNITTTDSYTFVYTIFPFSIWNLDFLSLTHYITMCIGNDMNAIEVIAFQYFAVFYALGLLFLFYIWLVLYNKGYRLVVHVTRPIHQQLARFWQVLRIEPSLMDSIALVYILCFTQLTSISFKLLHYATATNISINNTTISNKSKIVLFYDGTITYFEWPHAILGLLAAVVLILMVGLPTVCLLLYQLRRVQKLLKFLHLRRESLVALVDILTGAFRNSTKKLRDHRYFAGLFLLLRIALLSIYFIPYTGMSIIPYLQISFTVTIAGAIMIIRPYINNIHNLTNFLLLIVLAALSILPYLESKFNVKAIIIVVMYLPLLFAVLYCLFWLLKKYLLVFTTRRILSIDSGGILISTVDGGRSRIRFMSGSESSARTRSLSLPHRMVRPEDYKEMHVEVTDEENTQSHSPPPSPSHSPITETDDEEGLGESDRQQLLTIASDSRSYGSNSTQVTGGSNSSIQVTSRTTS